MIQPFAVLAFVGASLFLLVKSTKRRSRLGVAWIFFFLAGASWFYAAQRSSTHADVFAWALFFVAVIQMIQIAGSELLVSRVPRSLIVLDLLATVGYVSVAVSVLLRLGVNVTGVFATSALLTAVIGLSLQDLILNLVAGLFVQTEGNLRNGLWIQTERESGKIMELRARYTKIETAEGDSVYVPNSSLMKNSVRVVSHSHRHLVSFPLDYRHSPPVVIRSVQEALRSAPLTDVADLPHPRCFVEGHHTTHVQYGIHVWLTHPGHSTQAISDVLVRTYFALHRMGIKPFALSLPVEISNDGQMDRQAGVDLQERAQMLGQMDLFRAMNYQELQGLASALKILRYGPGDNILRQGDEGDSMFILRKGSVRVMLQSETGQAEMLAILHAGDFFGEMSLLTGAKRSASIYAVEEAECLRIDKSDFTQILERRSELVAEISTVLAARQASLSAAQESLTNQAQTGSTRLDLISRIERFFGFTSRGS